MKQIKVRVGLKDEPLQTILTNARKPFTFVGEEFIVTNRIGNDKITDKPVMEKRQYTVTHYRTGLSGVASYQNEKIDDLIERAKLFLETKKDKLSNALKNVETINK